MAKAAKQFQALVQVTLAITRQVLYFDPVPISEPSSAFDRERKARSLQRREH